MKCLVFTGNFLLIVFEDPSSAKIMNYLDDAKIVVFDEAQRIANIGLCIKIIIDNFPGVKVYATGSSAFELANSINEPLTGRKWEYPCFRFLLLRW